ncbi:MAG: hypothetical protein Harvfovirus35_10 [Harvfovirus sp.]|uniref:Uncharacterized protein n=1 Tax=Harvfovirus sp. TaxID=2487768 RepID=A0A3G5A5F1_9VIRU|nr:MAG: hypothetical protein Harvfovirus35_10 [Harvfovirus sp.]
MQPHEKKAFFGKQLFVFRQTYFSLRELHNFILTNFMYIEDSGGWRASIREIIVKLKFRTIMASREEITELKSMRVTGVRTVKTLLIHMDDAFEVVSILALEKNYKWKRTTRLHLIKCKQVKEKKVKITEANHKLKDLTREECEANMFELFNVK